MKTKIIILCFLSSFNSCFQPSSFKVLSQDPKNIFKDANFAKYYYSLKFSENYIPLDSASQIITKTEFYKMILDNNFVPIKIDSNNVVYYKLVRANPTDNQMILLKALVNRINIHYQMEGTMLPNFDFIDITGKEFSSKNTKGKIIVLKFWFIGCVACVEEMPAVNKIVEQYKNRQDILFISLAFDKKTALKKFLKNIPFEYATIPDQKSYIMDSLRVTSFPTHAIINKKGEIVKFVSTSEEMASVLRKESLK